VPKPNPPNLIDEILAKLSQGVTVRELAVAYQIPQATLRMYKRGQRGNGHTGRPRSLSATEERVCFEAWSRGEAGLYELASVYEVCPQTMRNILRRQLALECADGSESRHPSPTNVLDDRDCERAVGPAA
jgi:hypothetical protein